MNLKVARPGVQQLQWMIWGAVYLVVMLTLFPEDGLLQSSVFAGIHTLSYAAIICGNISLLYPRFYLRRRLLLYLGSALVLLLLVGALRAYLLFAIYNRFFAPKPHEPAFIQYLTLIVSGVLIFVLSFVFRIALAYFSLKKQAEEIRMQKNQAELHLLKAQVQPHFLFNTLNNIYYEAFRESPRTAALIERLSGIMRYFVDESSKESVRLESEVRFIENYLELEKIRIRHETRIDFCKDYPPTLEIPPMLLMTFIENIFKHGVDKSTTNHIRISLTYLHGYLQFQTENSLLPGQREKEGGFGLAYLRKRLSLLYGDRFELRTEKDNGTFSATLKIPVP